MFRKTVLKVSKKALIENLNVVKENLLEGQRIIAVVKANAYGMGAVDVAHIFRDEGIDFFAVASIGEAIELRENGLDSDIMVLSPFLEDEIRAFIDHDIKATITDFERAQKLDFLAGSIGKTAKIHIKVDSGMGRLGVSLKDAKNLILKISKLENIFIEGIFTHFPSADLLDPFTREQMKVFKSLCLELEVLGIKIPMRHVANSSGVLAFNDDPYFNVLRPGIILYGVLPSDKMSTFASLSPVAFWQAPVIEVKEIKKGQSVSYGRTFVAQKDMRIAVVAAGYADGFTTLNSGKAIVYINSFPCKLLGRVCMDYFMLDIGDLNVHIGDFVELLGDRKGIRAENLALRIGKIPYEILTGVSRSVKRIYF